MKTTAAGNNHTRRNKGPTVAPAQDTKTQYVLGRVVASRKHNVKTNFAWRGPSFCWGAVLYRDAQPSLNKSNICMLHRDRV